VRGEGYGVAARAGECPERDGAVLVRPRRRLVRVLCACACMCAWLGACAAAGVRAQASDAAFGVGASGLP